MELSFDNNNASAFLKLKIISRKKEKKNVLFHVTNTFSVQHTCVSHKTTSEKYVKENTKNFRSVSILHSNDFKCKIRIPFQVL